jgi:type I restriction enzyme S subunit
MSDWPTVPLGEALELAYGKSLPKSKRSNGGAIPVYGSNGITGWHCDAIVDGPTVIVGRKGSAGAVHYVEGPCYPIDTTYYVRPREGFTFDTRFLFYLLRWLDLSRLRTATGVPGLTREDAYRERIPVPSITDQRRIVDFLSRAESIVRLRREAQQKAAELIPAIFINMFGDPATNPKGWPVRTLGDVLAAADYGSSTKASQIETGLPIIRMGNVTVAGDLDLDDLKYVELSENDADRFRLRKGDLLFNRTNSKELVGKTGLWDGELDAVAASYFIRLRARIESAHPTYLWAWMNSSHMKRVLFATARGAIGQANINISELRSFAAILPPLELQKRFDAHVQEVRSIGAQQANSRRLAESAFESLLSRIFN